MLLRLALRLILVALAAAALGERLPAQSFDLASNGRQIIALDGLMRFHPGDDPTFGWANPAFDDSSWPLIRGDQPWYAQGYPHLTGFVWYRFRVILPAHPGLARALGSSHLHKFSNLRRRPSYRLYSARSLRIQPRSPVKT